MRHHVALWLSLNAILRLCRLYIMRLPPTGMSFDRITYHGHVTQCLGGIQDMPWYLSVAAPTGSVDKPPQPDDITAFRIPHGVFVKLHVGTWHAGPLFEAEGAVPFANLELSDTNVVDHNTHHYSEQALEDRLVFKVVP